MVRLDLDCTNKNWVEIDAVKIYGRKTSDAIVPLKPTKVNKDFKTIFLNPLFSDVTLVVQG